MTRRLLVLALLSLMILPVLAACGGADDEGATVETAGTPTTGDTVYTEDKLTIDVVSGDTFTIELPINPSTGYRWVPSMPMGYVQLSNEIVPTDGDAVGQPTVERWQLSVDTPGTGEMTFDLMPPGSDTPERTVTFNVTAR
jgi:predicted secreted protein